MSKVTTVVTSGGMSFTGLLTIIFIVMKLMGWGMVATWNWLWVLSPLWIGLAISLIFGCIGLLIMIGVIISSKSS